MKDIQRTLQFSQEDPFRSTNSCLALAFSGLMSLNKLDLIGAILGLDGMDVFQRQVSKLSTE